MKRSIRLFFEKGKSLNSNCCLVYNAFLATGHRMRFSDNRVGYIIAFMLCVLPTMLWFLMTTDVLYAIHPRSENHWLSYILYAFIKDPQHPNTVGFFMWTIGLPALYLYTMRSAWIVLPMAWLLNAALLWYEGDAVYHSGHIGVVIAMAMWAKWGLRRTNPSFNFIEKGLFGLINANPSERKFRWTARAVYVVLGCMFIEAVFGVLFETKMVQVGLQSGLILVSPFVLYRCLSKLCNKVEEISSERRKGMP